MKLAISESWIFPLLFLIFSGCTSSNKRPGLEQKKSYPNPVDERFSSYWFQGKAELTSYDLEQARYGEIHQGHAVLIFVTEPFSEKKHVKLDHPASAGNDKVPVLKLNLTKKFHTGIYPYSLMTSVFMPVEMNKFPKVLKSTTSSQEWCGNTFMQLDLINGGYHLQQNSYFESEGDLIKDIKTDAILEDQIWTMIRLAPESLPVGNIDLIPGSMYIRLRHVEVKPFKAKTDLEKGNNNWVYNIHYPELNRTLTITFEKDFPHQITGWEETYVSGFGKDAKILISKATLRKTIVTDYWNKNKNKYLNYRDSLGLKR